MVLVNPPYPPECHQHPPYIPLGLAYLGAVVMKSGFEVSVIDAQMAMLSSKQVGEKIAEIEPDLVGVTSTTLTYKPALRVAKMTKEAYPDCKIAIGGCHVTFWDQNVFRDSPDVDIIVRREGERTVQEFLKKLENHESMDGVLGITYKDDNGEVHQNPDRPYIENIDELPYPAFDLFPLEKYKVYGRIEFPIHMSRGCAFSCNYCSTVRMHGRKFRVREPKKVVDEIEFLINKYGAKYVGFIDDAFTLDLSKTKEFIEEMKNRHIKVDWDCQSRVDGVTKDLLSDMRKVGCNSAWFGVESGCERILEAMGKRATLDQARNTFKLAEETGVLRVANIIIGFPGETRETIEETVDFVCDIEPDGIGFYIATPYPGTPLWDLVNKMGWLKVTDWNKYDTAHPVFETPELKMDQLMKLKEEAYRRFYLRPQRVVRMLLKHNYFCYSEAKTSFAWFLRSLGFKLEKKYPEAESSAD